MTAVGLCFTCRWMRSTANRRGSVFFRCSRAEEDARYVRYPPLPVQSCPGFEEAMLFVVLMNYSQPLEPVDRVRPEHIHDLEAWADRVVVRALARRDPARLGVLVVASPDRD